MQLRGRLLIAVAAAALLEASSVGADEPTKPAAPSTSDVVVHAGGEFAFYSDTDAVTVFSPSVSAGIGNPLAGWSLSGSYLVDIVSGASVDIVATATPRWTEVRHAAGLEASYKPHDTSGSISASLSREPDYLSVSVGASASVDLANKQVTPLLGYAYSHDIAGRSDTPFSVYSLPLSRHTFNAAVTFVLSRTTELQIIDDVILESGDQIKPYRALPIFTAANARRVAPGASIAEVNALRLPGRISERTPLTRNRFALSGRLAHRGASSTLIFFERAYADDWGVRASTSSLRWVNDIGDRFFVWPELRMHLQSAASFWQLAYTAKINKGTFDAPEFRTGDRELSPLWTGTVGAGTRWDLGRASNRREFSMVLTGEAGRTQYNNALYVDHRYSGIVTLDVEANFE